MKKNFVFAVFALMASVGFSGCLPFLEDSGYGSCAYQMSIEGVTLSQCTNFIGSAYMTTAENICSALSGTYSETECAATDTAGNAQAGCCNRYTGSTQESDLCVYGGDIAAAAGESSCTEGDENGATGIWTPASAL
jgi:hypothetical protein